MGERLLCTQEVIGSIPIISTREWIKTLKVFKCFDPVFDRSLHLEN